MTVLRTPRPLRSAGLGSVLDSSLVRSRLILTGHHAHFPDAGAGFRGLDKLSGITQSPLPKSYGEQGRKRERGPEKGGRVGA